MFFETLNAISKLPYIYCLHCITCLFVDGAKGEITDEVESSVPSNQNILSDNQPNSSWGRPNPSETSGWGAPTSTEPENSCKPESVINNWETDGISSPEANVEKNSTTSIASGWGSAVTADAGNSGT